MLEKIQKIMAEVQALSAKNAEEAEALRIKYLSKKGEITALMNDFRSVPAELKKEVGMRINELKAAAQEKINALKEAASVQETAAPGIDLTRTPYPIPLGTRHPLTIVKNEIVDIFSRLGFTLAEGPEVEDDWHVYSSMNFADDHPARDIWNRHSLPSVSSARAACIATRPSQPVPTVSSTRWRDSMWIATSASLT